MARRKSQNLTAVEQTIMNVLWKRGPSSVREILEELDSETAYTTVQTMCKILTEKGYASFSKNGRAFIYRAEISQSEARKGALKSVIDQFFGGSPKLLAQHMMEDIELKPEEIKELQDLIDKTGKTGAEK